MFPARLNIDRETLQSPGYPRGGVLPYMAYKGMCRWTGYGMQFSNDMRGEGGSWVGICVPLASSLSFENSELNGSTA